ncbi:hypothetical protein KI387_022094, partial [Taxus chinensis]
MTILVANIPAAYGILLGKRICKDVGGEINMDWAKAKIPVNGVHRVLHPEPQVKYLVTKSDDPKAQILFKDTSFGNYFMASEIPIVDVEEEDPNDFWMLEFD